VIALARRSLLIASALLAIGAADASSSGRAGGRACSRPSAARACDRARSGTAARRPAAGGPAGRAALYWGAWIGSQLTGREAPWSYDAVLRFEQLTGKGISLVSFASPFANCTSQPCTAYAFPRSPFSTIRAHGAIPFFSWSSASLPVSPIEPAYSLRALSEGRFDSYIARWAAAARRWGHPFFLRFDWEMNSSSFPWSVQSNGADPSLYVAAWRHVHRIFERVGARNATWVWCPNAEPEHDPAALTALYPGSAYVDWTCLDGYNNAAPWRSFASIFGADYAAITQRIAPGKPMIVGETASTELRGDKAAWIAGMFRSLASMPAIRGLIWFDRVAGGSDWPAESSPASLQAFSRGVRQARFTGSSFSGLAASPIPRPRSRR
jgi:Glycosyl hydrolase family 26